MRKARLKGYNGGLELAAYQFKIKNINIHAAVAQWIEYRPPKPRVVGSIPASRATFFYLSLPYDVRHLQ